MKKKIWTIIHVVLLSLATFVIFYCMIVACATTMLMDDLNSVNNSSNNNDGNNNNDSESQTPPEQETPPSIETPPVIEEEEVRKPTVRTVLKLSRISPSVAAFLFGLALVFLVIGFCLSFMLKDVLSPLMQDMQPSESEEPVSSVEEVEKMPSYVGTYIGTLQQSDAFIKEYQFKIEEDFDENYPAGVVCRQSPREGQPIPEDGKITLCVSRGSAYVEMPYLVGGTLDFAVDQLNKLNIKYHLEDREDQQDGEPSDYPAGQVVGSDPEPGTRLRRFSGEVTLYVSR